MYTLRDKIHDLETELLQLQLLTLNDGITIDTPLCNEDYIPLEREDDPIYTCSKQWDGQRVVILKKR